MEGKVKFFNASKGFGFIQGEDGKDYFVHKTALANGIFLRDNDVVSFDATENDRGPAAQNVNLLKKGSEVEKEEPAEEVGEDEDTSVEETAAAVESADEEEGPNLL